MAPVLSDFQRGRIVGAREAGASISETCKLVGVSRDTVCRIMREYKKLGKTSAEKSTCGRDRKLTSRQQRSLKRIVKRDRRITAAQATVALNTCLDKPVSTATVRKELHDMGIHGRAAIPKPLIKPKNAAERMRWCKDRKQWETDQWSQVVFSDESSFTLFPTSGRVYVWRTSGEAYNPDCLLPTVKHGGGSVMVWGAISRHSLGPLVAVKGKIKASDYQGILDNQVIIQNYFYQKMH